MLDPRTLTVCVIGPLLVSTIAVAGTASAHDREGRPSHRHSDGPTGSPNTWAPTSTTGSPTTWAPTSTTGLPNTWAPTSPTGPTSTSSTSSPTSPTSTTSTSSPTTSVPADTAAEIAAWTRLVHEGQRRVFELTGSYVPLPGPPTTASAGPYPSSSTYPSSSSSSSPTSSPYPASGTGPTTTSTTTTTTTASGWTAQNVTPSESPSESSSSWYPSIAPADTPSATSSNSPMAAQLSNVTDGPRVGGWYHGSSGSGVPGDNTIRGLWADTSDEVQRNLGALSEVAGWDGALDLAVGGTILGSGETYAQAAAGTFDDRWRTAAAALAAVRGSSTKPTFVRPWHEFNGNWYDEWEVNSQNVDDYKRAFARYAGILREAMPAVYIVWSPNDGSHQDLPVVQMYPGDEWVDVVSPDSYDWTEGDWTEEQVAAYINRGSVDDPSGLESWRLFAASHGKPMGIPEWGLCQRADCGGDHPAYIAAMSAWMNANANTATWVLGQPIPAEASGKLLYSIYFNVVHDGDSGFTLGANPQAAQTFQSLSWGRAP